MGQRALLAQAPGGLGCFRQDHDEGLPGRNPAATCGRQPLPDFDGIRARLSGWYSARRADGGVARCAFDLQPADRVLSAAAAARPLYAARHVAGHRRKLQTVAVVSGGTTRNRHLHDPGGLQHRSHLCARGTVARRKAARSRTLRLPACGGASDPRRHAYFSRLHLHRAGGGRDRGGVLRHRLDDLGCREVSSVRRGDHGADRSWIDRRPARSGDACDRQAVDAMVETFTNCRGGIKSCGN